jgi:hypothetical protein
MWRGASSGYQSLGGGRRDRNLARVNNGMDQTSKLVVFVGPSDGRLRPHVRNAPSDKYRCAAYVLRSDARIGNGDHKQRLALFIREFVNKEVHTV